MPDASFIIPLLLQSAVIPFGVALALLLALRALDLGKLAPALALSGGFLAAYFAIYHAQWSLRPAQALDWMPWVIVLGVTGALVVQRIGQPILRIVIRLAISAGVVGLVAWPALTNATPLKAFATIAIIAVLMCAAWTYAARATQRTPMTPLLLSIVAGGSALAMMIDASQLAGQLSGALAMAILACAAINIPRVRIAFSDVAAGVAILLLGALLTFGYVYAGVSLTFILLLAGGLLAEPLVEAVNTMRGKNTGRRSWIAATVLTGIPVLIAIGLAVKAAHDSGGY